MIIKFSHDAPPVEELMKFEVPYLPGLQFTLDEKRDKLGEGVIGTWMWVDEELVGEVYGQQDEDERKAIYCWSFTCIKPSLGLGTILKANWLGAVSTYWNARYSWATGHARPGASQAIQAKFGAVFDGDAPDWFGTGETYKHYRIMLD
jgi:hypothetical protein